MKKTSRTQLIKLLKEQELELSNLFSKLSNNALSIANRYQSSPNPNYKAFSAEIDKLVNDVFLMNVNGSLVSYTSINGTIYPLSPYFTIVWKYIVASTKLAVTDQQEILQEFLQNEPLISIVLQSATKSPFDTQVKEFAYTCSIDGTNGQHDHIVSELGPSNPFNTYNADGFSLSDRVWNIAVDVRRKLNSYLNEAIRAGRPIPEIEQNVRRFLTPYEQLRVTNKPYGTNAVFSAMRLARTELVAAYSRSAIEGAKLNPFITGYHTRRRRPEPCTSCDSNAEGGPYSLDDTVHLTPIHPHCLCYIVWEFIKTSEKKNVLNKLQDGVDNILNVIGPLLPEKFSQLLLSMYS